MTQRISHDVNGDRILISVEFDHATIVAHESGAITITMDDEDWRDTAKRVLNESNNAERKLTPDDVVKRIRDALDKAATRAAGAESLEVRRMRHVSSVLHTIASFVQSGTITGFNLGWSQEDPDVVHIQQCTRLRHVRLLVELGNGAQVTQTTRTE